MAMTLDTTPFLEDFGVDAIYSGTGQTISVNFDQGTDEAGPIDGVQVDEDARQYKAEAIAADVPSPLGKLLTIASIVYKIVNTDFSEDGLFVELWLEKQ